MGMAMGSSAGGSLFFVVNSNVEGCQPEGQFTSTNPGFFDEFGWLIQDGAILIKDSVDVMFEYRASTYSCPTRALFVGNWAYLKR